LALESYQGVTKSLAYAFEVTFWHWSLIKGLQKVFAYAFEVTFWHWSLIKRLQKV